jgi:hypothetical protein
LISISKIWISLLHALVRVLLSLYFELISCNETHLSTPHITNGSHSAKF